MSGNLKNYRSTSSADYLDNKAEPRNLLETYQRITLSARLNKQWNTETMRYNASLNVDYGGSFDNDKVDPEVQPNGGIDKYKSTYNRYATSFVVAINSKNNKTFLPMASCRHRFRTNETA